VKAGFNTFRNQFSRPSIRLSYFDEVPAVEHAAINERRRLERTLATRNHARRSRGSSRKKERTAITHCRKAVPCRRRLQIRR
jgi:hypothetical protein